MFPTMLNNIIVNQCCVVVVMYSCIDYWFQVQKIIEHLFIIMSSQSFVLGPRAAAAAAAHQPPPPLPQSPAPSGGGYHPTHSFSVGYGNCIGYLSQHIPLALYQL